MKNYRIYITYNQHSKDDYYHTEKDMTVVEMAKSEYDAYKLGLEYIYEHDLEKGNIARQISINITEIN